MNKTWTVEADFSILTSVQGDTKKEARVEAKKALHELAAFIRPYCDCLDIELKNVDCDDDDEEVDEDEF